MEKAETEITPMEQCKVYKKCGGCQLQQEYPAQLAYKQHRLEELLSPFGRVEPIIGMARPDHYRNKVQAAFYYDSRRNKILSGVYQSTSQTIVPVDSCLLEDEKADAIVRTVRRLAESFRLKPYDIRRGTGFLRHVLVRCGFTTGEIMAVLVTASPAFPAGKHFTQALLKAHPDITTVVQNINKTATNLLVTGDSRILYGKGYIEDVLCGKTFRISPASFYQVNPVQCEVLYGKAMEFAGLTGREAVLDAYCGTGTIGLIAADRAKQVLGVELNREAVSDAIANARRNRTENVFFICEDAGALMEHMAKEREHFDTVFMDPPRAGASAAFLRSLVRLQPDRIVYISCNPETLARDLHRLTGDGYRAERIQGVDMFPHTKHVETVVLMTKTK